MPALQTSSWQNFQHLLTGGFSFYISFLGPIWQSLVKSLAIFHDTQVTQVAVLRILWSSGEKTLLASPPLTCLSLQIVNMLPFRSDCNLEPASDHSLFFPWIFSFMNMKRTSHCLDKVRRQTKWWRSTNWWHSVPKYYAIWNQHRAERAICNESDVYESWTRDPVASVSRWEIPNIILLASYMALRQTHVLTAMF